MEDKKAEILIVDDEPEIVHLLKYYLSSKGYNVVGALNGEEALSILEKEKPDLILLDLMMPGIKGTEVAKIVKEKYPNIKVIIVTGYPDESQNLLKDAKPDSIIVKPLKIQELYNKLSAALNPAEDSVLYASAERNIKARVLLIKAKLLFIDSNPNTYNFLSGYFKKLSNRGENYEIDAATCTEELKSKMLAFNPDILVVNSKLLQAGKTGLAPEILDKNFASKETIVYSIDDSENFSREELGRLTRAVEASCFKNGFIEIKWVGL